MAPRASRPAIYRQPSRTQTWTLDPLGNWDQTVYDSTTETRTHNSVNELTQRTVGQDPSISLSYDDAGNLTQDGDSDGDHKYVWDYRNRLIEVKEKQSGAWTTIAEYRYDAKARRVLKDVSNKGDLNGTTRYVWGSMTLTPSGGVAWQCLEERDSSGDLVARYTYSPGYVDSPAVQERDLNGDGDFGDTNEVIYYHSNTLHSIYALTDGSENVVERCRSAKPSYGSFTWGETPPMREGEPVVTDADWSADADATSDAENPYRYTARRVDAESGLMQYRKRYYSTQLGRFVSRDPLGYFLPDKANSKRLEALGLGITTSPTGGRVNDFNLYRYVQGNPLAYSDPMGLSCWTDCMVKMHDHYWGQTADCLAAVGVTGAVLAEACLIKCIFTGGAYLTCVGGCFTAVGVGTAGAGACCIAYYQVKMAGSAAGCSIGCYWD